MQELIKLAIEKINEFSKQPLHVISHNDTDGITSAAIVSRALQRWHKPFSLEIIKSLEKDFIKKLDENKNYLFLDLGSGLLDEIGKKKTNFVIFDHHEFNTKVPENVIMIHPHVIDSENIASSAIAYLFARSLSEQNKDLANLAVIGMIGDMFDSHIGKTYQSIIEDSETIQKKGLLLYPATRPIDRVLENSLSMFVPGVTGSIKGTLDLLREAGIKKEGSAYKSLAEMNDTEMQGLTTAILINNSNNKEIPTESLVGNIFLTKFFSRLEDARELSALINACSRMDYPDISLGFCLGNKSMKDQAEKIYTKYKKLIASSLQIVPEIEVAKGDSFVVLNAKDKIKDSIIGTIASIMSFSPVYKQGTAIIAMAHRTDDKIKVSARIAGRKGRNIRETLSKALFPVAEDAEIGGHPLAAGCILPKDKEDLFIESLKKQLAVEVVNL